MRDFSKYALDSHLKPACTDARAATALGMVRRPVADPSRYERVWASVHALKDAYEMSP